MMAQTFPRWRPATIPPDCGRAYLGVAPGYRHGLCVRVRPFTSGTMHAFPLLGMTKWIYVDELLEALDYGDALLKAVDVARFRLQDIISTPGIPDKTAVKKDLDKILFYSGTKGVKRDNEIDGSAE